MEDKEKIRARAKRLSEARMKLLSVKPFYSLLLMSLQFALDKKCPTAYTNGKHIAFNPEFLDNLNDRELSFVLQHELLHVALNHIYRFPADGPYDHTIANIAMDIVINSTLMHEAGDNPAAISIGGDVLMHKAPDGTEGHLHSVEEVYRMFDVPPPTASPGAMIFNPKAGNPVPDPNGKNGQQSDGDSSGMAGGLDDHSYWPGDDDEEKRIQQYVWQERVEQAAKLAEVLDAMSKSAGSVPALVEREIKNWHKAQTDWRKVLQEFVQEEITDYSFNPPDRRFQETDFYLPEYNEKEEHPGDILFFVDTSGSMSEIMIEEVFSEIVGAVEQFDGKINGWLSFFDASVVPPVRFESVDELKVIHPKGGGGTSFCEIFRYVREELQDLEPSCIVILTDGYAPFPEEEAAGSVPVLWLINNEEVTPPWGMVTRIKSEENDG